MAVTIFSAGGISSAATTGSIQSTTSRLRESSTVNSESSIFEDASAVTLSRTESARQNATSQALRDLSLAQSFVDVGAKSTDRVRELVSEATDLAEKITNEVDPTRRNKLATDAAALIAEIDTVTQGATLNGNSVVNAGPQNFQFDLTQGDLTSDNSLQLTITNIGIARSNLGLNSLTATSFSSDNENTITKLEEAETQLTNIRASLTSAATDIARIANEFGIEIESRLDNEKKLSDAQGLAESIAQSLTEADLLNISALDPLRVVDLISDDSEPSISAGAAE